MRVAYVAVKGVEQGGGVEKFTREVGCRLAQRGHQVTVYSSRDFGTVSGSYLNMDVRTVPSINTRSMHKMSICLCAILDVIRSAAFDVVHVHAMGPSVFSFLPRLRGIPSVVQVHGLEWKRDKWGALAKGFFKLTEFSAVYFPNRATCVSRCQKHYFEKKYRWPVAYIPTGVNPGPHRPADWILRQGLRPNRYVLFVARFVQEKGAHYLVEAFRGIDSDMKIVLAGDAPHADGYKRFLRDCIGEDKRFVLPGYVTDGPLEELYSNAYLYCLPSTMEGLPIALLEAMSYGNCCVVSDIPENMEALGDCGHAFRNRDAQDLRRVLLDLMDHPEKADAKKEVARERALAHYSWDRVTDRLEDLYLSLVG